MGQPGIIAQLPQQPAETQPSLPSRLSAMGVEASYVYALHARLAQVMSDAVHDGLLAKSPCSRRTSPGQGKQRPYVATTAQVWPGRN